MNTPSSSSTDSCYANFDINSPRNSVTEIKNSPNTSHVMCDLKEMSRRIYNTYEKSLNDETFDADIFLLSKIICYNRRSTNYHNIGKDKNFDTGAASDKENMIAIECIYNCLQNLNDRMQEIESNIFKTTEENNYI